MKALRRNLKLARQVAQKGFTLIELAVVGLFLGLLAVFAISQFSGAATDTTKASTMFEAAQKISDNWAILAQACAIPTAITTANVSAGTATAAEDKNLSLLLGTAGPATAYTDCYNVSGIRPLTGLSAGAQGAEKINDLTVKLAAVSGTTRHVAVTYKSVPANTFAAIYLKYSGSTTLPDAATTVAVASTTPLAYTAETGGVRDVTFVRPL